MRCGDAVITQSQLKAIYLYNPTIGTFVRRVKSGYRWLALEPVGSYDLHGYLTCRIDGKSYKMHRLAWLYVHGAMPDGDIDHINGNRQDNRIANLRCVPRQTNLQNQRKPTSQNKSTRILGVYPSRTGKRFVAAISVNNKKIHIGTFDTADEAYSAYVAAKRQLHEGNML